MNRFDAPLPSHLIPSREDTVKRQLWGCVASPCYCSWASLLVAVCGALVQPCRAVKFQGCKQSHQKGSPPFTYICMHARPNLSHTPSLFLTNTSKSHASIDAGCGSKGVNLQATSQTLAPSNPMTIIDLQHAEKLPCQIAIQVMPHFMTLHKGNSSSFNWTANSFLSFLSLIAPKKCWKWCPKCTQEPEGRSSGPLLIKQMFPLYIEQGPLYDLEHMEYPKYQHTFPRASPFMQVSPMHMCFQQFWHYLLSRQPNMDIYIPW